VHGAEALAVGGETDDVFGFGIRVIAVHEIELRARVHAGEQLAILLQLHAVPAHVRHADGRSIPCGPGWVEEHALAGDDAQGLGVVLGAVLQQDLAAHADAQQGFVGQNLILDHLVQARGGEFVHGLAGGPYAGKDDAPGAGDGRRIGRDGAGDSQIVQGSADTGLIAGLVFEYRKHAGTPR